MKVFIVCRNDPAAEAHSCEPLAVYTDKREADARRVCEMVKGRLVGPLAVNRDIPSDGKTMFRVEFTKDGAVRSLSEHSLEHVLSLNLLAGWSVHESRNRWRLTVFVWANDKESAETEARQIYVGVSSQRRAKSGLL